MNLSKMIEIGIASEKARKGAAEIQQSLQGIRGEAKLTRDEFGRFQKRFDEIGETSQFLETTFKSAIAAFTLGYTGKQVLDQLTLVEDSFIGLSNTTGKTGDDLRILEDRLISLTTRTPLAINQATELANAYYQLGVKSTPEIMELVETMEMLSMVTDLQGGNGARALGQLARASGESVQATKILGATINTLSDEFGGSESQIVGLATNIQLLNDRFGITAKQSLAISAVLGRLGADAGSASMVLTRLYGSMDDAFVNQFGSRTEALLALLSQLKELQGDTKKFEEALKSLGLEDRRAIRSIIPLVNGYEELSLAFRLAENDQENLAATMEEAERASGSIRNEYEKLINTVNAAIGSNQGLAGAIGDVLQVTGSAARLIFGFADAQDRSSIAANLMARSTIFATTTMGAFLALNAASKLYTMSGAWLANARGVGAFTAALARNPIGLIAIGVAAAVTAFIDFDSQVDASEANISSFADTAVTELNRIQTSAQDVELRLKRAFEIKDEKEIQAGLRERLSLLEQYSLQLRKAGTDVGFLQDMGPLFQDKEALDEARKNSQAYVEDLKKRAREELNFRREIARGTATAFDNPNTNLNFMTDQQLVETLTINADTVPVQNALKLVEEQIAAIKSSLEPTPKMDLFKVDTSEIDRRIFALESEIKLTNEFSGDLDTLNAKRERSKALADFQSEAIKTYNGRLIPAMKATGDFAKLYDQLTEAQKRSADQAKRTEAQKNLDKSLEAMRAERDLTVNFSGTLEDLAKKRERDATVSEFQARAMEAFGGRMLPAMKATAEYTKLLDDTTKATEKLKKAEEERANDDNIRKSVDQSISALETELTLIGKTSEERERANSLAEIEARIKESSAGAQDELNEKLQVYKDLLQQISEAQAGEEMKKMEQNIAEQNKLFGEHISIRRHAAEIAEYQRQADLRYGKGTKENLDAVKRFKDEIKDKDFWEGIQDAADTAGVALAQPFEDALFEAKNWKDGVESAVRDVSRIFFQQLVTKQIAGIASQGIMSLFPSAMGNAFNMGNVVPFADGGITTGPSYFPMKDGRIGLRGEAGTEAIMPLTRINGKLGVRATESSARPINVTFNFPNGSADSFRRSESQIRSSISRIVRSS
jgi:hypothetical protein